MGWLIVIVLVLAGVVAYDLTQTKHAILRNFPIIGHFRYWLEAVGPELRQYIVTNNDEERPFSRDQRRWVYASAKQENNYFGFGTDNEVELASNYLIIKHAAFPYRPPAPHNATEAALRPIPVAKVLGGWRDRRKKFRPASIINVSAMSFGSLSGAAIQALNRGCAQSGCLHNTGEGGISPHHDQGAGLIWQLGTGYFGARAPDGSLDLDKLAEKVERFNVRAIEIKLSQGAKPGKGGVLPGAKVTAEIANIRGIPEGVDCLSPAYHRAFSSPDELLDVVERIADATGLPVGIKSAVGELGFWRDMARLMSDTGRGVDYIQIDGGEGGTGAAPLVFSDHVAMPFLVGFSRVYPIFAEAGLAEKIVFAGSGKLGFPERAVLAMALGCDMVMVAREAMMAIGCIQAQKCETGHCPTGVATQNKWLVRGLDPTDKAARLANYMATFRHEVAQLAHACGLPHPSSFTLDHLEILDGRYGSASAREIFNYESHWGIPSQVDTEELLAEIA